MVKKISAEVLKLARKQLASKGGKARAKKYDPDTLSEWAKLGGRPKKKTQGTAKRGKRGRK